MSAIRKQPPIDADILAALTAHGSLTAYICGMLNHHRRPRVETAWVLRQLKRLEREGKVRRVPTMYRTQIAWVAA